MKESLHWKNEREYRVELSVDEQALEIRQERDDRSRREIVMLRLTKESPASSFVRIEIDQRFDWKGLLAWLMHFGDGGRSQIELDTRQQIVLFRLLRSLVGRQTEVDGGASSLLRGVETRDDKDREKETESWFQDISRKAKTFELAKCDGNADAKFEMAQFYTGLIFNDPYQRAMWLVRAADLGHINAMHALGLAYLHGNGVTQSHKEAARWLTKAADNWHTGALFCLGGLCERGMGVTRDTERALALYEVATALEPKDRFRLNEEYLEALAEARASLEGRMMRDHVRRARLLAESLLSDWREARRRDREAWREAQIKEAEDAPEPKHLYRVALAYYEGAPVAERDRAEANRWFVRAANKGHPAAYLPAAWACYKGEGVTENHALALGYFEQAASTSLDAFCRNVARRQLAQMYLVGDGAPRDAAQAVQWLSLAADEGDELACSQLAELYSTEEAVSQDLVVAYRWSSRAREINLIASRDAFERALKARMTPEQLAESDDIERGFVFRVKAEVEARRARREADTKARAEL